MMLDIVLLIIWTILGLGNLIFSDRITKGDYCLMFIVLMIQLIGNLT